MPMSAAIMPNDRDPLDVVTLVYDGLALFEYGSSVEIFARERPGIDRWYRHRTVGSGPVSALGGITLPNDPSVALHEAMGMRRVAQLERIGYKLGQWRDVGYWQINWGSGPPEPLRAVEEGWQATVP